MKVAEMARRMIATTVGLMLYAGLATPAAAANRSIADAVRSLRDRFCSPVSFIVRRGEDELVEDVALGATIGDALSAIAHQTAHYKLELINDRYVLYPVEPEYGRAVEGVAIEQLPRIEAADAYVNLLRARNIFPDLVSAPIIGDDRAAAYRDKVTLRPAGRVIDQLIDILGKDQSLFMEIFYAPTGRPYIVFGNPRCK